MSPLDFIASLVSSLAWPIVVLSIAWIFRKGIVDAAMAQRLQRLKASTGGLELEFFDARVETISEEVKEIEERQERQAEEGLDASGVETTPRPVQPEADSTTIFELLEISPRAAALEAYSSLEEQLRVLLVDVGLVDPREARQSMRYLAGIAQKAELIESDVGRTIHELTTLRNLLVHRGLPETREEFGRTRASDFIKLTREIGGIINRIPRGRGYEVAVQSALRRIGVTFAADSASRDQGWDLLIGRGRRAAAVLKFRQQPLGRRDVEQARALTAEKPVLLISKSTLTSAAALALAEDASAGHAISFVRWSGPQDDDELATELVAAGVADDEEVGG